MPGEEQYREVKRFTATLDGVPVHFSTEDPYSNWWFFPRYAGGRIHERPVTEMLIRALRSARCFVDVGTHLGWYTCLAAKHMPQGSVHGFEMDELNFALLKRNLELNGCTNVEAHHLAVADAPGVVSYERAAQRPSPNFSLRRARTEQGAAGLVSIASVALDDFSAARGIAPDVVKIDVEGAELLVLKGMRRILKERKPRLFVEVHPKKLPAFAASTFAILSLLVENEYRVFEIESLREQASGKPLKPLSPDATLEATAMLYATPAQE